MKWFIIISAVFFISMIFNSFYSFMFNSVSEIKQDNKKEHATDKTTHKNLTKKVRIFDKHTQHNGSSHPTKNKNKKGTRKKRISIT